MFTATDDSTMINSWSTDHRTDAVNETKMQESALISAHDLLNTNIEPLNVSSTSQLSIKYTNAVLQDADSTVIDNGYNFNNQNNQTNNQTNNQNNHQNNHQSDQQNNQTNQNHNSYNTMNAVYDTNSNFVNSNLSNSSLNSNQINLDQNQQQVYYQQSSNKLTVNESYPDYQYDNNNQVDQNNQFDNDQIVSNQLYLNEYAPNNQLTQQQRNASTNYSLNNSTNSQQLLDLAAYQSDQSKQSNASDASQQQQQQNRINNNTISNQNRINSTQIQSSAKSSHSKYLSNKLSDRKLRPHSTPVTLIWLEDNYEIADGVCIPRSTLYAHYVDFCGVNCIDPVNAASFGKIIRQKFPQLTTRRLGTRGQSRYHYYGIAIKETSIYHHKAYSKKDTQIGNSSKESGGKARNVNEYFNGKINHKDNLHNTHISDQNLANNVSNLNYSINIKNQQHQQSTTNQPVNNSSTIKQSQTLQPIDNGSCVGLNDLTNINNNLSSLNNLNNSNQITTNLQANNPTNTNLSTNHNLAINGSTINLPEFPNVKDLRLRTRSQHYSNKHLISLYSTFLMMYRTHCQRILDTLIRCNLNELNTFISYFWQAVPEHLKCVLAEPVFHCLIAICDCILYKCMTQILYAPLLHSNLPDNLIKILVKFSDQLEWNTETAMCKQPEALRSVKLALSRKSACLLRRQSCLNKYICETRIALSGDHNARRMLLTEFRKIDMSIIFNELLNKLSNYQTQIITTAISEFEILLEDSVVDNWLNWINGLLNKCISVPSHNFSFSIHAKQFVHVWNLFSLNILKQLNAMMSPLYKIFILIRNLFNVYILYTLEYLHFDERIKEFTLSLYQDQCPQIVEPFFQDSTFDFKAADLGSDFKFDYNTINNIKTERDIKLEMNDPSIANYFSSKSVINSDCNYDADMYTFYNSDYYPQNSSLQHDNEVFSSLNAGYHHCRQFANGTSANYQATAPNLNNFNNHFYSPQLNGYRTNLAQSTNHHHHLHHHLHQQTYHNYLIINNTTPNESMHYYPTQDSSQINYNINNIVLPFQPHQQHEQVNQTIDCNQVKYDNYQEANQENQVNCFQNGAY